MTDKASILVTNFDKRDTRYTTALSKINKDSGITINPIAYDIDGGVIKSYSALERVDSDESYKALAKFWLYWRGLKR